MMKTNALAVLKHSTIAPFRQRDYMLRCVYCNDQYEDPVVFRDHVYNQHKQSKVSRAFDHWKNMEWLKVDCTDLKCKICAQTFEKLDEVAPHLVSSHGVKLFLNCGTSLQPYKLDKNNWMCYNCNMKFASLNLLCRHTNSHYKNDICEVCGKSFLSLDSLTRHKKNHSRAGFPCKKCRQTFPTLALRYEHIKTTKKCMPYCCTANDTCFERFMSYDAKLTHMQEAHGVAKRVFNCPDCSLTFDSKHVFYSHYQIIHAKTGFKCSYCGQEFVQKHKYDIHTFTHTGEKNFSCDVCSKSFNRQSILRQHMYIHSESKRFSCSVCGKKFAQKVCFVSHMKSQHPDVQTN